MPASFGDSRFVQAALELEIRQAGRLNFAACLQNQRALDHIAQLTHVAGPVVRKQFLPGRA